MRTSTEIPPMRIALSGTGGPGKTDVAISLPPLTRAEELQIAEHHLRRALDAIRSDSEAADYWSRRAQFRLERARRAKR